MTEHTRRQADTIDMVMATLNNDPDEQQRVLDRLPQFANWAEVQADAERQKIESRINHNDTATNQVWQVKVAHNLSKAEMQAMIDTFFVEG